MALHTRLSNLAICALGATAAAAHVLLPFSHRSQHPQLSARAASEQISLKSAEFAYVVDVTVGTPPQKLSLIVSSSTGDTWVPDANTDSCSPEWYYSRYSYYEDFNIPEPLCEWGSFNKSLSQTYLPANSRYSSFSGYVDQTTVSGENLTDKLVVGNVELDDYPMGVVSSASRWIGTLGLGYNTSYSYSYSAGGYASFMDRIVSSGKVATPAYSMWLDNAEGTSGGLLFGAIDRSRYTGDLLRLQDPSASYYSSSYSSSYSKYYFSVTLTAINGTTDSGSTMPPIRTNDFPVSATIGPGEVFSYLPGLLADKMATMAGATYNQTLYRFTIPCDAGKTNAAKFVLQLGGTGGPLLNVETADLVVPVSAYGAGYSMTRGLNGTNTCFFGVQKYYSGSSSSSSSSSYDVYNLGSSLLRRTYLVFDLANQEIAVAPVKFASGSNAPSPTIVAFEKYGASAPSATLFCASSRCAYDCTDSSCTGPSSTSSSSSGSGSRFNGTSSSNQSEHWRTVAIAVGVTFGILTLIGIVAAVIICMRLARGKKGAAKDGVEEGSEQRDADGIDTPSMSMQNAAAGAGGGMRAPGALPIIQERQEDPAERNTQTQGQAPQLPALGPVARPITPPEPAPSSNRASVAVSALSEDQPPTADPESAPKSPKGKGIDRPVES